jgi:hypothetical protein
MQTVEVDHVHTQALQARIAGHDSVLRMAGAQALGHAAAHADVAELGADQHLVAFAGDCLADQLLVHSVAVRIRSDDQVHTELDRAVNGRNRFRIVALPVADRHAHTSETERRNFRTVASQLAILHGLLLRSGARPQSKRARGYLA